MAYKHYIVCIIIGLIAIAYSARAAEYYHTPKHYACMLYGQPSAYGLAKRIAKEGLVTHEYDIILESNSFNIREMEPIHLAYALYLISERIGDDRARRKMQWLERYLDTDVIDRITSVIYRKYSKGYLETCFSIDGFVPPLSVNDIYPLYMD